MFELTQNTSGDGGGERYTVPRDVHRRRIQDLGAAISRRDWHAVEMAHAEIRDAFDRPDIYDPAAPAAKGRTEDRLRETLIAVRDRIASPIYGGIDDTFWMSPTETVVDFIDTSLAASPPPPAGADTSLNAWELAEERKRADLFVAKLNEAEGYATRLAQSLSDKHFLNPDWRPLPDLYGVLTQIDNMTTGLVRKVDPPAGAAGGGSGDLGALRSAAQAVLDAIIADGPGVGEPGYPDDDAYNLNDKGKMRLKTGLVRALRDALSAPTPDLGAQGEPVAWAYEWLDGDSWWPVFQAGRPPERSYHRNIRPLYEAPAAPRSGSAVTVEEIEAASAAYYDGMIGSEEDSWPHHRGWAGKSETFKDKVRAHMARALKAALHAPRPGETGDGWEPTGRGTGTVMMAGGGHIGSGGTTEWFRKSDGAIRSFPHRFNPNTGCYEGLIINTAPSQPHTAAQAGDGGGR